MIPKIIHYCWFGKEIKSKMILECIASWKKFLPDYKIIEWNEDNYQMLHPFAIAAYEQKKWAFVSDYARFDILFQYGGIYLDTDMAVLKNIDFLLEDSCFFGYENEVYINAAIIGAQKLDPTIKKCLDLYSNLTFTNSIPPIPQLITPILLDEDDKNVIIYPSDYFYPLPFKDKENNPLNYITNDSLTVHLWNTSWQDEWDHLKNGFKKSGLKLALKKIRKNPFQTLNYYLKLFKFILPDKVKNVLKSYVRWLLKIGLKLPHIKSWLIRTKLIPFYFKYRNFPQMDDFKNENSKICNLNDILFYINISKYNGWRTYYNLFPVGTQNLFEIITSKFIIIDVGANLGYYTLNFAKKARKGTVISFEPYEPNFKKLQNNIKINDFSNIYPYRIALGHINSKISLNVLNDNNLGMIQVEEIKDSNNLMIQAPIMMLDDFIKKNYYHRPIDLIKIDIEGYELNFIKGAINTIKKFTPILFIELSDINLKEYGHSASELIKKLEELGYNSIIDANSGNEVKSFYDLTNIYMDIICKKIP
jgi:FkbM family methyltransferase